MAIPDSLTEKMSLFRHRGYIDTYRYGLFAPPSWIAVFLGQGLLPQTSEPLSLNMPLGTVREKMQALSTGIRERVQRMPTHGSVITDYCPAAAQ
jgi:tryptophan halogenase